MLTAPSINPLLTLVRPLGRGVGVRRGDDVLAPTSLIGVPDSSLKFLTESVRNMKVTVENDSESTNLSDLEPRQGVPEGRRSVRSRRLKLVLVIVTALALGVLGRALADGNLENSFLADVMPWMRGTSVTLYFGEPSGRHIVPVTRTLSGDQESPGGLVEALLGGPAEGTILLNAMPDGTTALSASVEGSTFSVNLSAAYLAARPPPLDEAVVQTLMSWPGVDDVQIAVEGDVLALTGSSGHLAYFFERERDMLVATPIGGRSHRELMAAYLRGPDDPGLVGMPADVRVTSLQSAPGSGLLVVDLTYTAHRSRGQPSASTCRPRISRGGRRFSTKQ